MVMVLVSGNDGGEWSLLRAVVVRKRRESADGNENSGVEKVEDLFYL